MQNSKSTNSEKSLKESETSEISPLGGGGALIRRAVKEDCVRMMELITELAIYEKAPEQVTVDFNHFVESGFGEKAVWWAFVATLPLQSSTFPPPSGFSDKRTNEVQEGAEVVGFALYYIRYSTWKGQRLYLEDLLVTEKMRGKGVGKLLFDQLIEECKAKKYSGMMWQVLDWNEPAINFYKKYPEVKFDDEWINCSINFAPIP